MKRADIRRIILVEVILIGVVALGWVLFTRGVLLNPAAQLERPADLRMLFVGNSFTAFNDLDQLTVNLTRAADPAVGRVVATEVAYGGYRIPQHRADANTSGTLLNEYLITGSEQIRDWDFVVLQAQSQIPGLDDSFQERPALFASVRTLSETVAENGGQPMLLMTWGYAAGDPRFPEVYPDYPTMQQRLAIAYDEMARQASTPERPVYVIPVGLAWRLVYGDVRDAGGDPLAEESRFRQLYADDLQHPALPGSYLTASVAAAAMTGTPVSGADWVPRGLDADYAAYLREVADRVVFGGEMGDRAYPWQP